MYNLSYGERLLNLGFDNLEVYFKILHGNVDLQFTDFFKINNNRTTRICSP